MAARILEQIHALPGMADFKRFADRAAQAAENMRRLHIDDVPMPNLIFSASPGCGVTLHIRLLTDLLKKLRLMRFAGEEECFEWAIANAEEDFDQLLQRVRYAAGFYGRFRGVIGLDLRDLLENAREVPPLDKLMAYVEARQGEILFVFVIPCDASEQIKAQLLSCFASRTPAEMIEMPFPQEEALDYVADQLRSRGYCVLADAAPMLRDAVAALSRLRAFEGYQTLQNLADEIVWRKLSHAREDDRDIGAEDVAFVTAENGLCARMEDRNRERAKRIIGFGAEAN